MKFGWYALAGLTFAAGSVYSNELGAPLGATGAPGEDTCVVCHAGTLNSGSGRVTITFPGGSTYAPGQAVRMRVTVEDPTARRWGFSITAKREASNVFAGSFSIPAGTPSTVRFSPNSSQHLTHSINGTFRGMAGPRSWEFDWTAPSAGTGPVRFYAAGNAANNDGSDNGDRIYTSNLAVAEASSGPNTVLPQFAFGGGWSSYLYFTNTSSDQVSFPVRFYTDTGADLSFGGTSTRQMIIPAGGTALIQAQNTGDLQQGWATWDMPAGVVGYGVFRQAVPGRPDQEAVVPFSTTSGTRASLIYDDSNLTTGLAIWYNGSSSATVTLTARDESGAQIGTGTVALSPGTKTAFALSEKIPAISLKRGWLEVTTSTGNIAVLGLRFTFSAFTSIPPSQ